MILSSRCMALGQTQVASRRRPNTSRATHQARLTSCISVSASNTPRSPQRGALLVAAAAKTGSEAPQATPTTARGAVEMGLSAFKEKKDYRTAVKMFQAALELKPNDEEAMAALYNLGCAHTKLKEWGPATAAIMSAVNDHRLKLSVAKEDPDLRELRERREWVDALSEMKGGLSQDSKVSLRAEAKSPFRLTRLIFFGAFLVGGSIGSLFSLSQVIGSLSAGVDLSENGVNLQNLGVNALVVAVTSFLINRDLKSRERQLTVTNREESLARLQIDLGNNRQLPLGRFRGKVRPVILAGTQQYIDKAMREAKQYYEPLRNRGVSIIPVVMSGPGSADARASKADDPEERIKALKREFQKEKKSSKGFSVDAPTMAASTSESEAVAVAESRKVSSDEAETGVSEADRKWQLQAYDTVEWQKWVRAQREAVKMPDGLTDTFIQVQLDGTVRSSGLGVPPWAKFLDDLPTLDSIRTTFTDGIGPSM